VPSLPPAAFVVRKMKGIFRVPHDSLFCLVLRPLSSGAQLAPDALDPFGCTSRRSSQIPVCLAIFLVIAIVCVSRLLGTIARWNPRLPALAKQFVLRISRVGQGPMNPPWGFRFKSFLLFSRHISVPVNRRPLTLYICVR